MKKNTRPVGLDLDPHKYRALSCCLKCRYLHQAADGHCAWCERQEALLREVMW